MMTTILGVLSTCFGLIIVIGQLISATNFGLAQKLGLQESDEFTDSLFRQLERNTARWDLVVMWALPTAGVLILLDNPWWPPAALVAGAFCIDTAGRESAKFFGLRKSGVKTGSDRERRMYLGFLVLTMLVGLWSIGLGLKTLS